MVQNPDTVPEFPFSVKDAVDAGVSRAVLRSPKLSAPFRGVRASAVPSTVFDLCRAHSTVMGEGACYSHSTAANAWGMWLPRRLETGPLHVTAVLPARAPRMTGVIGHKAESGSVEIVEFGGLLIASPLDAWRQLSTMLSLEELIAAGDSLVRRSQPLVSSGQLIVALARHGNHRGVKKLRLACDSVRSGCDSARETKLRLLLIGAGLPEPVVNALVSRPGERRRYGDLVYRKWKVIVEYDGMYHLDPAQIALDIQRLEELAANGWTVIRVLNEHLANPHEVIARVRSALRANGWRG